MSTKHRNNRKQVKVAIQGKTGIVSIQPRRDAILADALAEIKKTAHQLAGADK